MPEPEETPAAIEEQDGSQETTPDETLDTAFAGETDSTTTPVESPEKPSEYDWSQHQNAERYKGRTVQEVIDYYHGRDQQYGDQANELGRLRQTEKELNALRQRVMGQPSTEKKPMLSEAEMAIFDQELAKNPAEAIMKNLGPKMTDSLTDVISNRVGQRLAPAIQKQAQEMADRQEIAHLERNHPEVVTDPNLRWMTQRVMQNDYVGGSVPYEQAFFLAKMGMEEKSLFPITCELMRGGMSFDKAKEFAQLKQNAPANAQTTKEQIKQELTGVKSGTKRTATKKSSGAEDVIKDMDDAFDVSD